MALGLAFTAARLHPRVLLIDGNLKNPILHKQIDSSNEQGLTNFLNGQDTQPFLHCTKLFDSEFDVLTSGYPTSDPSHLLSSQSMRLLMTDFERKYDLAIVISASAIGTVDVLQTVSLCHGAVLLTRLNRILQNDLDQAISLLHRSNLIGIVVGANTKKSKKLKRSEGNQNLEPSNKSLEIISE